MARNISNTEESGSLGGGMGQLPQIGYATPTAVPSVVYDTSNVTTAGVEYHSGWAKKGVQTLDDLSVQFDNLYISGAAVEANQSVLVGGQQYLSENKSGKGYCEFVTGVYKEKMEQAISDAPNRRSRELLSNHYRTGSLSLLESSYKKELEIGRGFTIGETETKLEVIKTQTYMNPSMQTENLALMELTLSNMQPYLRENYGTYRKEKLSEFWESTAKGEINIDPLMAKKKLESGGYDGLVTEKRVQLIGSAQSTIDSRGKKARSDFTFYNVTLPNAKDAMLSQQSKQLSIQGKNSEEIINKMSFANELNREKARTEYFRYQQKYHKEQEKQEEISQKVDSGGSLIGYGERELAKNYIDRRDIAVSSNRTNPNTGEEIPFTPIDETQLALSYKTDKRITPYVESMINNIEHGDSMGAYLSAQGIETVSNQNPNILGSDFDLKYKAFASYVSAHAVPTVDKSGIDNINKVVKSAREQFLKNQTAADISNSEALYNAYIGSSGFVKDFSTVSSPLKSGGFIDSLNPWKEYGEFGVGLPANLESQIMTDSRQALKTAYLLGNRGTDAVKFAQGLLSEVYGKTYLNSPKAENPVGIMTKHPLEKMYPHYTSTALRNFMYADIEAAVKENMKNDPHSEVKLNKALVRTGSKAEAETKDLTTADIPVIKAKINGKWEDRQVYYETADPRERSVRYYYLQEQGNFLTKRWLKLTSDPIETRSTF